MKPAADGMQSALDQVTISTSTAPIVSGLDGALVRSPCNFCVELHADSPGLQITTPSSLISNLVTQISGPVRWSHCLATLRATDASRLIFLGPGKALANLARRDATALTDQKADVVSVATDEDLGDMKAMWEE